MKVPAELTAYYPSNEGVEGGYYDALGNPLNPDELTCAAPKCIPFHTKIKISNTGTKYDNNIYTVTDRGGSIVIDDDGIYHVDLLLHNKEEVKAFGRRKNAYIEILKDGDNLKTQNGFTLLENAKEIKEWLAKQKVTRKITKLQVHHMDAPSYSTWEKTDKRVFAEPHFGRTQSLNDYGKKTWGSGASDGHRHYIAQHFNVFPDGKITTGRNLNSTPIGIRGWNTNAICIEIYGKFDKGHDVMNAKQKEAVIALYGELCKRFGIPVDTAHIRPHCWFTAGGTYLGKYDPNRSAKTCPGTNFWGTGCSKEGFNAFIRDIKDYVNGKKTELTEPTKSKETVTKFKPYFAKPTVDDLNCRKGAGTEYDVVCTINTDTAITVVDEIEAKDGGIWLKCKAGYFVNKKYMKLIKYV